MSLFRNKFLTHSQFLPHILVIGIKTKQNTFFFYHVLKIKLSSKCNRYKAQIWYLWHSCLLFRKAPTFLLEIASDLDRRVLHPQIYCSGQLGQGQKCWSLKMETFVCGEKRNTGLENVSSFFSFFILRLYLVFVLFLCLLLMSLPWCDTKFIIPFIIF